MKTALLIVLIAFAAACSSAPPVADVPQPSPIRQVTAEVAKSEMASKPVIFIDVRTPEEFKAERVANSINIPLDKLDAEIASLDKTKPVYIICETGRRSLMATKNFEKAGFSDVVDVQGGISAWKKAGLPVQK